MAAKGRPTKFDPKIGDKREVSSIYALTDPDSGEVRYVGKANDPEYRYKQHIKTAHSNGTPIMCWLVDILFEGKKPGMEILEVVDRADWENAERKWIAKYRECGDILNVADGGNQPKCSHETYVRIGLESARTRDKKLWDLKQKMGISLQRGWVSERAKKKLRFLAEKRPDLFGEYKSI